MLSILGMGSAHPRTIITNQFLEDLAVGTNAQWIMEKIGIQERVSSLPLEYILETKNQDITKAPLVATDTALTLAVKAAKQACERAKILPKDLGLVIVNSCTPVDTANSVASQLVVALGSNARAYDLQTACPAFALHVHYLNSLVPEKLPKYVLCVSSATTTQSVNYNDRTDGAIWGDGAAAWVVSPVVSGRLTVIDTTFASDPSRAETVVLDTFGYFHQDGRAVRDFSVRQTVRMIKALEERFAFDWTRDSFIGHQANATMLEQIISNREIPPSQHWHNVEFKGNQAGAGAPAVLAEHWDKIVPGQKVVVAVLGAGLSWGSILFEAGE